MARPRRPRRGSRLPDNAKGSAVSNIEDHPDYRPHFGTSSSVDHIGEADVSRTALELFPIPAKGIGTEFRLREHRSGGLWGLRISADWLILIDEAERLLAVDQHTVRAIDLDDEESAWDAAGTLAAEFDWPEWEGYELEPADLAALGRKLKDIQGSPSEPGPAA